MYWLFIYCFRTFCQQFWVYQHSETNDWLILSSNCSTRTLIPTAISRAPRRFESTKVVEDSTRIASRHATRGMKIDQRTWREDRDDASISKVVEWFRARAHFSHSLPLPLVFPPLFPTLSVVSSLSRSNRCLSGNMSVAIWIWIIRNFLYLISSYISHVRVVGSRTDDVSDRVSISRLSKRSRISAAFK